MCLMESAYLEELHQNQKGQSKVASGCVIFIIIGSLLLVSTAFIAFRAVSIPQKMKITYTEKDFKNFLESAGISLASEASELCLTCPITYSGFHDTNVKLTNEQASAWFSLTNETQGPISDTKVRFEKDQATVLTMVTFQGKPLPVLLSGDIKKEGDQSIRVSLDKLKIGNLSIPVDYIPIIEAGLTDFFNRKLSEVDGLNIEELEIEEGYLYFEGTVPTRIFATE